VIETCLGPRLRGDDDGGAATSRQRRAVGVHSRHERQCTLGSRHGFRAEAQAAVARPGWKKRPALALAIGAGVTPGLPHPSRHAMRRSAPYISSQGATLCNRRRAKDVCPFPLHKALHKARRRRARVLGAAARSRRRRSLSRREALLLGILRDPRASARLRGLPLPRLLLLLHPLPQPQMLNGRARARALPHRELAS